jgi:hypothetical protein
MCKVQAETSLHLRIPTHTTSFACVRGAVMSIYYLLTYYLFLIIHYLQHPHACVSIVPPSPIPLYLHSYISTLDPTTQAV